MCLVSACLYFLYDLKIPVGIEDITVPFLVGQLHVGSKVFLFVCVSYLLKEYLQNLSPINMYLAYGTPSLGLINQIGLGLHKWN